MQLVAPYARPRKLNWPLGQLIGRNIVSIIYKMSVRLGFLSRLGMLTNRQTSQYQDVGKGTRSGPKDLSYLGMRKLTVQLILDQGFALIVSRFSNSANKRADGQRILSWSRTACPGHHTKV
jgi:hypothetical protein